MFQGKILFAYKVTRNQTLKVCVQSPSALVKLNIITYSLENVCICVYTITVFLPYL